MPVEIATGRLPTRRRRWPPTRRALTPARPLGVRPVKRRLLKTPPPGDTAQAAGRTLHSYHLGLLPILNRLLTRLRLEPILRDYLPPEDR